MPYSYPNDVPDYIKNLPEGAQKLFIQVFNETMADSNDEDKARQAGWGAVKNQYEQVGDEWKRKATESQVLRYVSMLNEDPPHDGGEGTVLSQVQVFRTGTFYHRVYGKFTITTKDLEIMKANFDKGIPKAPTEMVVDYEHMSALTTQVSPAAGWVKSLEVRDGKLYATVEWTEEAAGFIGRKEYRFISPEWVMDYTDKESNKNLGPALLSIGLTNRPFIDGMAPVMLSEALEESNAKVLVLSDKTINGLEAFVAAEWDAEYINDLPDDCFAYIEPGGEKDEDGKTVPRSLRKLPYKTPQGNVSLPHLRNALARLDQTDLSSEAKAEARRKLESAAEEAGVGEEGTKSDRIAKEEPILNEEQVKEIRDMLGISEEDDIVAAVKVLVDKVKEAEGKVDEAETKVEEAVTAKDAAEARLLAIEVDADITKAIQAKLILPKQEGWAKELRAKDPEAFKAYLATLEPQGPDTKVKGSEENTEDITLTASEIEAGSKLGVSKEELLEQKKRDKAVASA